MTSRASFYQSRAKHAQRQPVQGYQRSPLQPMGTDTAWIPEFVSCAQGTDPFNADSMLAMQLGSTHDERVLKLRQATRAGVLHMFSHRDADGQFVEYRWELSESAKGLTR